MDDADKQAGQAESLKAKEKASKVDGGETNENQFNRSSVSAASRHNDQRAYARCMAWARGHRRAATPIAQLGAALTAYLHERHV